MFERYEISRQANADAPRFQSISIETHPNAQGHNFFIGLRTPDSFFKKIERPA